MKLALRIPALAIAAVVLTATVVAAVAAWQANAALERQAEQSFVALRDARAGALRRYLQRVEDRLQAAAHIPATREALREMAQSVDYLGSDPAQVRRDLQRLFPHGRPALATDQDLDRRATSYRFVRQQHDPWLKAIAETLNIDDVLLVGAGGKVLYSAHGSTLLGAELAAASPAERPLADLFRNVAGSRDGRRILYSDLTRDTATDAAPRAYAALPVLPPLPGGTGGLLGAVVFALTAQRLNEIMQATAGMGESGETYLVSPDLVMRTQSRVIGGTGGRLRVDTIGAQKALGGMSGVASYDDYRGVPVVAAFGPIDLFGSRWALLAEIDRAEVFAPARRTAIDILLAAAAVLVLAAGVAAVAGRRIARPIAGMSAVLEAGAPDSGRGLAPELRDIHDRFRSQADVVARSEQQLQSQSDILDAVLVQMQDGVLLLDGAGRISRANDSYEFMARAHGHAYKPGDVPDAGFIAAELQQYEDGTVYEVTRAALPGQGKLLIFRNVSRRVAAEAQAKRQEEILDSVLEAVPEAVRFVERDLRL